MSVSRFDFDDRLSVIRLKENRALKFALCVATKKGLAALQIATKTVESSDLLVCTFDDSNVQESYASEIREYALKHEIPIFHWGNFKRDPECFIRDHSVAKMLCIGWRYLVPSDAVSLLNGNVVVAHDSLLPRLRGFAPLPTALISGETKTGVTFLRAAEGVDEGEILWQGSFDILFDDTISKLIDKTLPLYEIGTVQFLTGFAQQPRQQRESDATYSIWRDHQDYRINWLESNELIERKVRASSYPYLGARARYLGQEVVIESVEITDDVEFSIRQPGKVWCVGKDGCPVVVCGSGMIKITNARVDGESIIPMKKLRVRFE